MAIPAPHVYESGDTVKISATLHDVDRRKLHVYVKGCVMIIEASLEEHKEEHHEKYSIQRRRFGEFEIEIKLPRSVSPDKARATFHGDTLDIVLRKAEAAEKVPVKFEVRIPR